MLSTYNLWNKNQFKTSLFWQLKSNWHIISCICVKMLSSNNSTSGLDNIIIWTLLLLRDCEIAYMQKVSSSVRRFIIVFNIHYFLKATTWYSKLSKKLEFELLVKFSELINLHDSSLCPFASISIPIYSSCFILIKNYMSILNLCGEHEEWIICLVTL